MVDIPEAKKCCFCLPLRRGLLAWVYFKVAILVCITTILLIPFTIYLARYTGYLEDPILALLVIVYIILGLAIIFDLLFIISAHKKKVLYLRVYYRYEVTLIFIETIVTITYGCYAIIEGLNETHLLSLYLGVLLAMVCILALHAYFVYLLRSEVKKLELSTQFTFKNLPNDPECTAQILE